jgi:SpoVK/Ycf46/Vps4 family AAA+-type ATPase
MPKKESDSNAQITSEFLIAVQHEAAKAWNTCVILDENADFGSNIKSAVLDNSVPIAYLSQHLILRDLCKLANEVAAKKGGFAALSQPSRFFLLYMYEKFQGRDLREIYSLAQLNDMVRLPRFDKNVSMILAMNFFPIKVDLESEYIVPSILQKMGHPKFEIVTTFLRRAATIFLEPTGKLTAADQDYLNSILAKIMKPKVLVEGAQYNEVLEDDTLEKVMAELHELIGMDNIKQNIADLVNFLKVKGMREEQGLKTTNPSLHSVFMGPPGTGKTTVARLLGRIYKHLGYLTKGHLVETDRAGMVAGYVGQTAIKSDEVIKSAVDGVLFIDEAYSLRGSGFNDFGNEAIEIILKRMEDNRNRLSVVVAGYPDEMRDFIQSNPGLQSRFNRYFQFDHFTAETMMSIFKLYAKKADFRLTEEAEDKLQEILDRLYEKRHAGFGNARVVRNLFEKIIEIQANRIVVITPITSELLMNLTEEDIPDILKTVQDIIQEEDQNPT